jgi:hypothetical protein
METLKELEDVIREVLSEPEVEAAEEINPEATPVINNIQLLTTYMIDSGMNIQPLPTIELVYGDMENAEDFFGKTAYYDFANNHIRVYAEGRHPRDIVRSFAHEMIHHIQNLEGRLVQVSGTNVNEDDNLVKLEEEANLLGTMTFRKWADTVSK